MASTVSPKLAAAKAAAKRKKKRGKKRPSTHRLVKLGDPEIQQLRLHVNRKTGECVNMGELVDSIDALDVDELKLLCHSLFGKPTRLRNKQKLIDKIHEFLARVQESYEGKTETAAAVKDSPEDEAIEAKAAPASKPKPTKAKPVKPAPVPAAEPKTEIPYEPGTKWKKRYKGASYELVVVEDGYRLDGPSGHPACGKVYGSPTGAAKAITGYASQDGVKWWGMKGDTVGRGSPFHDHLKIRDPRLPMLGETIYKVHDDVKYSVTVTDDNRFAVHNTEVDKPVGEFGSISAAADHISECKQNGYKFFCLDHGVETLDPWRALAVLAKSMCDTLGTEPTNDNLAKVVANALESNATLDVQAVADALARHYYKTEALAALAAKGLL